MEKRKKGELQGRQIQQYELDLSLKLKEDLNLIEN